MKKVKKIKTKQPVQKAKIYIQSTFNNTIVTVTDTAGNTLSWASSGSTGFRGTRKSTPFASQQALKDAVSKARSTYGISEASILVSGVGVGRESAVRALPSTGVMVTSIRDITPIPHNGPSPKKPRRV